MENNQDFVIENGVLTKYNGPGGDVTIPEGVTVIGEHAFFECASLTSVTIPEGVTEIGRFVFDDCKSLTDVTIPGSVREIGKWAVASWPNPTIHAPAGSVAERYAKENGIRFEAARKA